MILSLDGRLTSRGAARRRVRPATLRRRRAYKRETYLDAHPGSLGRAPTWDVPLVVQKSLHEGFGLTVTEAMWKGRPIVASATGGIQDQIADGVHGLLVDDPYDLRAFGAAVQRLLEDRPFAEQLRCNARERARQEYLGIRHVLQYARLLGQIESWPELDRLAATNRSSSTDGP